MATQNILKYFLWGYASLAALATASSLFAVVLPYLDLVNHFRPAILISVLLLTILSFFTTLPRIKGFYLFILFINVSLLIPSLLNTAGTSGTHENDLPPNTLNIKLMTLNIWFHNQNVSKIISAIKKENPDIVVLQEVTTVQATPLFSVLKNDFPYLYDCSNNNDCQLAFLSKEPWSAIELIDRGQNNPPIIHATFPINNRNDQNDQYHILATHISWPFKPDNQHREITWLSNYINNITQPLILAGDLNLSPWSWKMFILQSSTGLNRHTTFLRSWPAHQLLPFVLLDHVLASKHFSSQTVYTGEYCGSDHLPIISKLHIP